MNKSQVIIVHIGPVQDFIMAARRTRDLWFGSWLLSELSKAAALKIVEMNDNDLDCLVFPAPESNKIWHLCESLYKYATHQNFVQIQRVLQIEVPSETRRHIKVIHTIPVKNKYEYFTHEACFKVSETL